MNNQTSNYTEYSKKSEQFNETYIGLNFDYASSLLKFDRKTRNTTMRSAYMFM